MQDLHDRVDHLIAEALDLGHGANCCEPERALALLAKASYLSPERIDTLEARADILIGLGDLASAAVVLRKIYQLNSENSEHRKRFAMVLDAYGCVLLEEGALERARSCFDETLSIEKRQAPYWIHRALAYLQGGNINGALGDLNEALRFDPDNGELYILRAKIYWTMQYQEKAVADIKKAKRLCRGFHPEISKFEHALTVTSDPGNSSVPQCMLNGDFKLALEKLQQALRTTPSNVQLLLQASTAARQLGKLDLAAQYSEQAELFSKRQSIQGVSQARALRALVYNDHAAKTVSDGGNVKEALSELTKAIDLNSQNGIMYRNRGDCYRLCQDYTKAEADYNKAIELDPVNASVGTRIALLRYYKGQELFNRGKFLEAEALFTDAIELSHHHVAEYYANRGLARICSRQTDEAIADFKNALRLDPHNPRARSWIASSEQDY